MHDAGGIEKYLTSMSQRSTWADGITIAAAVDLFQRSIVILQKDGVRMELSYHASDSASADVTKPSLYFGYTLNHYVSLRKVGLHRYDTCF